MFTDLLPQRCMFGEQSENILFVTSEAKRGTKKAWRRTKEMGGKKDSTPRIMPQCKDCSDERGLRTGCLANCSGTLLKDRLKTSTMVDFSKQYKYEQVD